MPRLARWLALGAALALACGRGDGGDDSAPASAAPAAPDTTAGAVTDTALETMFTAVDLPESFPSDFPIPPQSTVTGATSTGDQTGIMSNATIMSRMGMDEQFLWYKDALIQAGWTIATEGQSDQSRSLHAQQGESYVDIVVARYGESDGWTQVVAVIWKSQS